MLCVICLSSSLYATAPCATRENIDKKKAVMGRRCTCGKTLFYTLATAASGFCIFLGYKFYKSMIGQKESVNIRTMSNDALTKRIVGLEKKVEALKEPAMFSWKWTVGSLKSVVTSFISSGLAGIVLSKFRNFYKCYNCFDNVTDFIAVRLEGANFIDELLYNAQLFDHFSVMSEDDLQKGKERFTVSLNNFVASIEYLVAFMEYKIDSFQDTVLSEEDILLSKHLFDTVNTYCAQVENIFSNGGQLFAVTSILREDVIRYIEGFRGLENRVTWMLK